MQRYGIHRNCRDLRYSGWILCFLMLHHHSLFQFLEFLFVRDVLKQ